MQVAVQHEPDTPSKERLRLWLRFLKTSHMIEAAVRENLRREFGTTLPRFDVMSALSRFADGLKMSQLSDVLRVSNGNVTGIVDRLSEDGFLIRVSVPGDRRATVVRLTNRGREEFERQAKAHETWIDEMLRDLSPEEARQMGMRLDQLETSIVEERA
ncbi:MAG: MarR family winged helix-turn-helix transcriptional regulator [Pikeienuella sp.]